MIRSKPPARGEVAARAEDYYETTIENHTVVQRLNDIMRLQVEQAEKIQSVADMLQLIDEKLEGHTKANLTVAEVAKHFDRSEDTIRRWIKRGKLKADRVQGTGPRGRLSISREALVDVLV